MWQNGTPRGGVRRQGEGWSTIPQPQCLAKNKLRVAVPPPNTLPQQVVPLAAACVFVPPNPQFMCTCRPPLTTSACAPSASLKYQPLRVPSVAVRLPSSCLTGQAAGGAVSGRAPLPSHHVTFLRVGAPPTPPPAATRRAAGVA